ncbi:MAG: C40 family peptidase [Lachnospiraceae bacterium]|nr:C40 family peptidase [Lachnospiraceae bacterium]
MVSSEAAVSENDVKSIQPVTVNTVQEVTSDVAAEEQTSVTPEVVKANSATDNMVTVADNNAEIATANVFGEATATENGTLETGTESVEIIPTEELEIPGENVAVKEEIPAEFQNLVIAQVNDYVNVRAEANTEAEIVGKLYDESVGTLVEEKDGWYQITSGNVTGYVKAEFCVTGEAAIALAEEVGTKIATVNTTTLKVRSEANIESSVLGLVPLGEELVVVKEEEPVEGWVKISIEEGEGYVSTEYVSLRTDFVKAESKEEEAQRLAQEAAARAEAQRAAQQAISNNANNTTAVPVIAGDSEMGVAVAEYACQFVGNPYVWGGTSLTNGADCSGFVMSVYANFGVALPHSSTADRTQGYAVDGIANAQPGDLVCYSGHVALYIGNGQIVHASSSKTGIIISDAEYKKILAVRRIF